MPYGPVYEPTKFKAKDLAEKHPQLCAPFYNRPFLTRRRFFRAATAGLTGAYLAGNIDKAEAAGQAGVVTQNTAKNVIFILLTGALSPWDSFDLKVINGVTPASFNPTVVNGINWPMGLFPKIGGQLSNIALVQAETDGNAEGRPWVRRICSSTRC